MVLGSSDDDKTMYPHKILSSITKNGLHQDAHSQSTVKFRYYDHLNLGHFTY